MQEMKLSHMGKNSGNTYLVYEKYVTYICRIQDDKIVNVNIEMYNQGKMR